MSDNFFDSDFENRIVSSSLTSDDRDFVIELMRLFFKKRVRKKEINLEPVIRKK